MRRMMCFIAAAALLIAAGCAEKEHSITASYSSSVFSGEVMMTGDLSGASPDGITVRVLGAGIAATTDPAGRFLLVGVPDGEFQLWFSRGDGIDARCTIPQQLHANATIEVSKKGAKTTRRHSVDHPQSEIEGTIKAVSSSSLTVTSSHKTDVTVGLTDSTVIRKGETILTSADLTVGERVHVRTVTAADGTVSASLVIVQNDGTSDDNEIEIKGTVSTVGTDSVTITAADGTQTTVKVDANTVIRSGSATLQLTDLKVGDVVEVEATRASDGTLVAKKIQVEKPEPLEISGTIDTVGTDQITVKASDGTTWTVKVDANTVIRNGGQTLQLSDLESGDQVEVTGTPVDATTIQASRISVESD
jgi:archaellum component FlaF (FlaF/FlaG flagellin family)